MIWEFNIPAYDTNCPVDVMAINETATAMRNSTTDSTDPAPLQLGREDIAIKDGPRNKVTKAIESMKALICS